MGCCSSKTQLKNANEPATTRYGGTVGTIAGGTTNKTNTTDGVREPTMSEKRARAAEAAENRKGDWRQGGFNDPEKAKSVALRREKDELLGKIYNRYSVLGKEPPIGLPSCDVDQLRRHLEGIRK